MEKEESNQPVKVTSALLVYDADHDGLDALTAYADAQGVGLERIEAAQLLDAELPQDAALPSHWVVAVDDARLAPLLERAVESGAAVGLLPAAGSSMPRLFDLPHSPQERIALALSDAGIAVDCTRCNGELVLNLVAIGDVPFLDQRGEGLLRAQPTRWRRGLAALGVFANTIGRLWAIRPSRVRLQIGDEDRQRGTAVTGIVVFERDLDRIGGQLLGEAPSALDGRLSVALLAPASVAAYLAALRRALFGGEGRPRALSFIKSKRLAISSDEALPYRIDGRRRSAKSIVCEVQPEALRIKAGSEFCDARRTAEEARDALRLQTLPEHETRLALLSRRLPLFTHALEGDFRELFQTLRESARVSPDYVVLMLCSTLLASLGLVLNSAAVIIGAMILAPLMAPIISLSMGALRRDLQLVKQSIRAILIGVALAMALAALLAWLTPLRRLTPEIEGRLNPGLLDLGVAVVAGVAAAYAYARESVVKSLPGVAIAVALVPPLAVSGIGLGWGDLHVFSGALLLFLTNLVGIAVAAGITFMLLGYAPVLTAARGLRELAVLLLVLYLPLHLSFARIVEVWRYESALGQAVLDTGVRRLSLSEPVVRLRQDQAVVRAVVAVPAALDAAELDAIQRAVERTLDRPVRLELDQRLVRDPLR